MERKFYKDYKVKFAGSNTTKSKEYIGYQSKREKELIKEMNLKSSRTKSHEVLEVKNSMMTYDNRSMWRHHCKLRNTGVRCTNAKASFIERKFPFIRDKMV